MLDLCCRLLSTEFLSKRIIGRELTMHSVPVSSLEWFYIYLSISKICYSRYHICLFGLSLCLCLQKVLTSSSPALLPRQGPCGPD